MSKITSSGVMFDGMGEAVGDRDGMYSFGIGWGESECVFGVGDVSDGMGDVIGVKWAEGEGTEFNSGDPIAIEDVSAADAADDSEMSETWDAGEGVAYEGSMFNGNSVRLSWICTGETAGLSDKSFKGSGDGVMKAGKSTGNMARSVSGSGLTAFLHSAAIDPLMIFSTSSSSLS